MDHLAMRCRKQGITSLPEMGIFSNSWNKSGIPLSEPRPGRERRTGRERKCECVMEKSHLSMLVCWSQCSSIWGAAGRKIRQRGWAKTKTSTLVKWYPITKPQPMACQYLSTRYTESNTSLLVCLHTLYGRVLFFPVYLNPLLLMLLGFPMLKEKRIIIRQIFYRNRMGS